MYGAASVVDLVELTLHGQAANRDFDEISGRELAPDGNARQNRHAVSGYYRFLDGFGATELHGNVEQLVCDLLVLAQQASQGIQSPRAALPGYKFFGSQIGKLDRLSPGPGMILRHHQDHLVIPYLLEGESGVLRFETDKPQFNFAIK